MKKRAQRYKTITSKTNSFSLKYAFQKSSGSHFPALYLRFVTDFRFFAPHYIFSLRFAYIFQQGEYSVF